MTVYRMATRFGNQGYSLWPQCLRLGVAAITYEVLGNTDLSKHQIGEPAHLWNQLEPAQKANLWKVAYEMDSGDIIYVKEGKWIVGRGRVVGSYQFDGRGRVYAPGGEDIPFVHQVPVAWQRDFVPVEIDLGANPTTVLVLDGERLRRLEQAIKRAGNSAVERRKAAEEASLAALEGQAYRAERTFRRRNRALIEAKKLESNGKCSVCGFSFVEQYLGLVRDCLTAHHAKPIGKRKGASKTTLDDIHLLCPNCHAAVHTEDPPIPIDELCKMLVR